MKITIKKHGNEVRNPGDVARTSRADGSKSFIWSCVKCGTVAAAAPEHNVIENDGKYTMNPSIICNKCGWHGWIKDNEASE